MQVDIPKSIEAVLKFFSDRDKDTLVFSSIVLLTVVALILKAEPWAAIGAGFGFVLFYILMRYALLKVQLAERETEIKRNPSEKAEKIIDATANDHEKMKLEKVRNSAREALEL